MSKITSADCVTAIVDLAEKDGPNIFYKAFEDLAPEEALKDMRNPKMWKRISKSKNYGGAIERTFDCTPFDDQLRAVVCEKDGVITWVTIEGE